MSGDAAAEQVRKESGGASWRPLLSTSGGPSAPALLGRGREAGQRLVKPGYAGQEASGHVEQHLTEPVELWF